MQQPLEEALEKGCDGRELGALHARSLRDVLRAQFDEAARAHPIPGLALAAVGSLGRGAVALGSDADVRVLVPDGTDTETVRPLVDALLYPLWDAKVPVSHHVATESQLLELARTDLTAATALLDLAFIAGDPRRVADVKSRAAMGLFSEDGLIAFVDRLAEEADARHRKFGGSVYLLEPDVKSGEGGLRDLMTARWAAVARFDALGTWGEERQAWRELVRLGVLVEREAKSIAEAEELLWRVRNRLHRNAGRRNDRLTFDQQEAIAIALGFCTRDSGEETEDRARGAEAFMQEYYNKARVVTQARELLFDRARVRKRSSAAALPRETDLGGELRAFDGHVTLASAAALTADPSVALRLFAESKRLMLPVHPYAKSAVTRVTADPAWCAALRESREAAHAFVELVCTVAEGPGKRGSLMAELHDVGLLLAMIPEFGKVTGRVHHDVYHVYTVDVHSVAALDCLRALARGELTQEQPLASRVAAEISRPVPLFLATLLHDVGKGYPDETGSRKNHSKSGAQLCEAILPRLGLSPAEVAEAKNLVTLHLAMYHVATRRDLEDPQTIEEFLRPLGGREALRDLFLLTVADVTTTSPTAMTSWKARMLEELYRAADAHLAGKGPSSERAHAEGAIRAARALPESLGLDLEGFLASMPDRYLLANPPESVVAHARVAAERTGDVKAALAPSRHRDAAELCVVADDRPGLLAKIAAAITAGRLEVLAAEVYSRRTGDGRVEAVDLFWVRDRVDGLEGVERALPRLERDLAAVCAPHGDAAALLKGRSSPWRERPSPPVPTEVVLDDRASPQHTVIEVSAKDRPGLLYSLAQTICDLGLSIAVSKINTEGTRALDVFYVQEIAGGKVPPGERFKEIQGRLRQVAGGAGGVTS